MRTASQLDGLGPVVRHHLGQALLDLGRVQLVESGPADTIWQHAGIETTQAACNARRILTFVAAAGGVPPGIDRYLAGPDDRLVAASAWSRDRIVENGIAAARVVIVPLGVDQAAFAPLADAERAAARASLGLQDDETVLLNIADGHEDGGVDLLIRAVARLHHEGLRIRLLLRQGRPHGNGHDPSAMIARANAEEPGGIPAAALAVITCLTGTIPRDALRYLYGAADCFVSPYRQADFNLPALEAIACGRPVVVTDGGATDAFCDDDVAIRIPAQQHVAVDGATGALDRRLEPDLDKLTEALALVAQDRAFDPSRFAQARIQRLGETSWAAAAETLEHLLCGQPGRRASRPAQLVIGLPIPSRIAPVSLRVPSRSRPAGADSRLLSVVVQGPCHRTPQTGAPTIDACLASIRSSFPGAQIIVSTWLGSDIDGLDADDIVLNHDPGPLEHKVQAPCNVNRMLTTTQNGLAAATRPFCIKTRSDVLFRSDALAALAFRRAAPHLSLERRIWTTGLGTWHLASYLRPFHVGDMVQHGATDDLRLLWEAPAQTWDGMFLPDPAAFLPRMCPEQALLTCYLARIGRPIALDITIDGRMEVILASLDLCLGGFDVFDEEQVGVVFPQRLSAVREIVIAETEASFAALREAFSHDRTAIANTLFAAFQDTLRRKLAA